MTKINNNHGMTLMETLTAAMIFVTIFMLTFGALASGNRLWAVTDANSSNQMEVRGLLMDLERKVRSASALSTLVAGDNTGATIPENPELFAHNSVIFTSDGITYHYFLKESESDGNEPTLVPTYQLIERTGISSGSNVTPITKVIANNIIGCLFLVQKLGPKRPRLVIKVTARKTTPSNEEIDFTIKHVIALRNADPKDCSNEIQGLEIPEPD